MLHLCCVLASSFAPLTLSSQTSSSTVLPNKTLSMHCHSPSCTGSNTAALHCTALHCITLLYATLRYSTLRYATLRYMSCHFISGHDMSSSAGHSCSWCWSQPQRVLVLAAPPTQSSSTYLPLMSTHGFVRCRLGLGGHLVVAVSV